MAEGDMHFGGYVGRPTRRVDGVQKVTGAARYAAEHFPPGLLHAAVVSSGIAKGRILSIDAAEAEALPGVVRVLTHLNTDGPWRGSDYDDMVGPPGAPFRPLHDARVLYSGQPIAVVVAETLEAARDAASLVKVRYQPEEHVTDLDAVKGQSYEPPKKRNDMQPPKPRGDAEAALGQAPVRVEGEYRVAIEHHNPMEPFATTVVWEGEGRFTVYDKTQAPQNVQQYLAKVFGLEKERVRVCTPFMGGGFGAGLRPQYQVFLATMASVLLQRSVRLVMTREQMFTFVYRPETLQTVKLGAERDGTLTAIRHHAVACTSHFEDHQEVVVNWSGLLYDCPNVKLTYELAKIDTYTPGDMRAPGAVLGVYALESAMDELACALEMDPLELRLKNYAERDNNEDKALTSKALRAAFRQGAERFGWARRSHAPRSMREGRELVGWGMASAVWEAMMTKAAARLRLTADGRAQAFSAFTDIGTGTYTIIAMAAADALGLRLDQVDVTLGASDLPTGAVEGGSWTAASVGTAIQAAGEAMKARLLEIAAGVADAPLQGAKVEDVVLKGGRIALKADLSRGCALADLVRMAGGTVEAEGKAGPDKQVQEKYAAYTHAAVFCEVKVDEELGVVRVTRIVDAVAAGRIMNPKTARSQILGGVVMAMGAALTEESLLDHGLGRFMNHNLAEYHVPANADVHDIEVIFVEEPDDKASPIGVKGLGEIGVVGVSAAIANAIHHATGRRVRGLPITLDKLLPPAGADLPG